MESFSAKVFVDPESTIVDVAVWDEFAANCVLRIVESIFAIVASLKLFVTYSLNSA